MMTYRVDSPFIILTTTGRTTAAERDRVYEALRSDSSVPIGAHLIIDLRKYEIRLTDGELQDRVRAFVESLGSKIDSACAVVVGDTSLRIGLSFQMAAANMKVRVGVFRDEESARAWLVPGK